MRVMTTNVVPMLKHSHHTEAEQVFLNRLQEYGSTLEHALFVLAHVNRQKHQYLVKHGHPIGDCRPSCEAFVSVLPEEHERRRLEVLNRNLSCHTDFIPMLEEIKTETGGYLGSA